MRVLITFLASLNFLQANAQSKFFRPTFVYDGYFKDNAHKIPIHLNFLILLDSTMVGSYYYTAGMGTLKLAGKLQADNRFYLVERNEKDSITGYFRGRLSPLKDYVEGIWTSTTKETKLTFALFHPQTESYWDYIRRNRSLSEYKNLRRAIKNAGKVQSIDVADQKLNSLPAELARLHNIESINLLGNAFTAFPPVLGKLTSLDELSLCSNHLSYVGPEIGNLLNLRIL